MIYQLMKRDEAWRSLLYVALVTAVISAFAAGHPELVTTMCGFLGVMVAFVSRPHQHASRFEASLPIAGRHLFLARTFLLIAAIWLPAIVGCAAILISRGAAQPAVNLAGIAVATTLASLVVRSVRIRSLSGPNWLMAVFICTVPAAMALVAPLNVATPVLLVGAPLSVALFLATWRATPKSFQIAAAGTAPARSSTAGYSTEPVTVWLPVLRSVFSWQYCGFVLFLCFITVGTWIGILVFWLPMMCQGARQHVRWTRAFPLRPRVVLWVFLIPALLALTVAYVAGFHFGVHRRPVPELRVQFLDLSARFGWALLILLFLALYDWRRLRSVSPVVRKVLLGLLLGIPLVASMTALFLLPKGNDTTLMADALLRLSGELPGSLAAVIALAVIPLAALSWALTRVFEEAEYADKPRTPIGASFLQT